MNRPSITPDQRAAFAAWTAANRRAARAYRARLAGLCVTCEYRKRDGEHVQCWACSREQVAA